MRTSQDKTLAERLRTGKLLERIMNGDVYFPPTPVVSTDALDLLSRIFQTDPRKRIHLQGIMRHPWFVKVCSGSGQAWLARFWPMRSFWCKGRCDWTIQSTTITIRCTRVPGMLTTNIRVSFFRRG